MRSTKILMISLVTILMLTSISLPVLSATSISSATRAFALKGPRSDNIVIVAVPSDEVNSSLGTTVDAFMQALRPSDAIDAGILSRSDIKVVKTLSEILDLMLNPAPVYVKNYTGIYTKEEIASMEGVPVDTITYYEVNEESGWTYVEFGAYPGYGINPFAFKEVRYAINFLVNRQEFIDEYLSGLSEPMYMVVSPSNPMMYYVWDIYGKYRFPYSPGIASKLIEDKLTRVGAEKIDGVWHYDGRPTNITVVIRVEDYRRNLGDMISSELERLGFIVTKEYATFSQAVQIVYNSDPAELKWHIYTEGWISGGYTRWDPWHITQFAAPWFGWMPGYQRNGWWQYKNATIDEITDALCNGRYSSGDEYISMYRRAIEIATQEAVRIYVATPYQVYPMMNYVEGETADVNTGLRNVWNLHELYVPGEDTIVLGVLTTISLSGWNPYGGLSDRVSILVRDATSDPLVARHPFSCEAVPFRATYEVLTASPDGTLNVPSDAVVWDSESNKWVQVSEGVTAKSVVIFNLSKLIGAKWHHNITITWADVIAAWAYRWELAQDPDKSSKEPIYWYTSEWFSNIKGLKFDTANNLLYIYTDYWHFDPNEVASYVCLNIINPVELDEIMFYLAFNASEYALTDSRAGSEGIPWLSLVDPDQVSHIKQLAESFINNETVFSEVSKYTRIGSTSYLTMEEWNERLQALINWIDTYGNAWVSQGAYKLAHIDSNTINLTAFRDPSYPFMPGDCYYGYPEPTIIEDINLVPVHIGEPCSIDAYVSAAEPARVSYVLRYPATMTVVDSGDAVKVDDGHYVIQLSADTTSMLEEGKVYELLVYARSEDMNTFDIKSTPLHVEPLVMASETVEAGATEEISASAPEEEVQVNVEVAAEEPVEVVVSVFEDVPITEASTETGSEEPIGYGVDVYVNETEAVRWPMYIEVHYNEADIPPGVPESSLAIYYYNLTANAWMRCSITGVNTAENYVWANITKEEYEAGIGNTFAVFAVPPSVGGELEVPGLVGNCSDYNVPAVAAALAGLVAIACCILISRKQ